MKFALTSESLPVTKGPGDGVCSSSTCKQGEIEAVVIATSVHTFFGKAAHLVDTTNQVGHFQKVRRCVIVFLDFRFVRYLSLNCLIFVFVNLFVGLNSHREFLHMFHCCGNGNRDHCNVPNSGP